MTGLFSGRKRLRVDWRELEGEGELLCSFLRKSLGDGAVSVDHHVWVDSGGLSAQELKGLVNKFIYHRHLNNECWVALEGGAVRIHRFKEKKSKKRKKPATPPSTIKHGWL